MKKKNYMLFPNIIPVAGYKRGVLCDLFSEKMYLLPKDLVNLLHQNSLINIYDLLDLYGSENKETILEYLSFLKKNKIVFPVNPPTYKNIPKLNLEWDRPSTITNALIAIDRETTIEEHKNIFPELSYLGCKAIGLVVKDMPLDKAFEFISYMDQQFDFIYEIIIEYPHNKDENVIINNVNKLNKIIKVIICGCEHEKIQKDCRLNYLTFHWLRMPILNWPCSVIAPNHFNFNMEFFCEASLYNSCLNRKVSIDCNGEIKNCLAMQKNFGNIKKDSISKVICTVEFSKVWMINKSKIDVCKDCEFRFVCTDCRAFIKDSKNLYSQPSRCKYNPFIAKWENEPGYVPVEECGIYSKEKGFLLSEEFVEILNKKF